MMERKGSDARRYESRHAERRGERDREKGETMTNERVSKRV